jgi:restriction endonuclease S subunit
LKTSVVNLNKVKGSSKQFRFDAEYFKPEYLAIENIIKAKEYCELRDCISHLGDYHSNGSYETLRNNVTLLTEENYAYMIRTVDLERNDYETDVIYVDEHAYNFLSKSKVFGTEVIVNKIGNAGKVYIVPPLKRIMTLGMNQFMIRSNKQSNNLFLYVYLTCKYGKLQLKQRVTGAVPLSIDKESVKSVFVPVLDISFCDYIAFIIKKHLDILAESKKQYKQAGDILLSELCLLDWQPKHKLSFVKNYSDTEQFGRIDAEYFQPKYEKLVKAIKDYKGGWDTLGNLVSVKKCVEVGSGEYIDEGIPFIRVSNISPFEMTEEKYISEKLYSELIQHQPKQGEILFSKDATPGIAYHLNCKTGKMIPSGGILRLKLKDNRINEDYLTLVLNSLITKEQINRDVGGSVILHWRPDQVKETLIPLLSEDKQVKIQQKISESFNLRKQSKHLLEVAKKGVEMAIEKDEKTAMKWIERECESVAE